MRRDALLALLVMWMAAAPACRGAPEPKPRPLPEVGEREPLLTNGPLSPRIASYEIRARLHPDTHRIAATETLTWKNTAQRPVDELPFHLYMNAFKNESSLFMRESHGQIRGSQAAGTEWGWIDVSSIRVAGDELRPKARFPGPDETVLELPLEKPVEPGETVKVELSFVTRLPQAFARTGFVGDFHMAGQWFPKIGVLAGEPGEETWTCEPFHALSEFFADFGTYDVELTVPNVYQVAATGVLVGARDNGDGTRTLTYRAEDVHDFAWAADPFLEVLSGAAQTENGEVEVLVYYRAEQRAFAERHLRAGIAAVEIFSRDYLPYPYRRLSIIDPPLAAADSTGGMEYSTLVTTGGDHAFLRPGIYYPESVTIHEVGHNWFQGIIASNEAAEPWLDEGVNEYADGLVMEELYGTTTSAVDWEGFTGEYFVLHTVAADLPAIPDRITKPSHEFVDFGAYAAATYSKTAVALRTLEKITGSKPFRAALAAYARRFAFKHPTGADFFGTLESEIGHDLDWFTDPAFHRRGLVDFRVRDIHCEKKHPPRGVFGDGESRRTVGDSSAAKEVPFECEVVVENLGEVPAPTDVEIRFEDDTRVVERWEDHTFWHRFHLERTSPVAAVVIDPNHEVPLNVGLLGSSERVHGSRSAPRRAAARAQFWTQTLMQGVGL